jgi:hypothetical protein
MTKALEKEKLKSRIDALRPLPLNWRVLFGEAYPEYNTIIGANLLTSVGRGDTSDISIVEKMEKLFGKAPAKKSKSKKQSV